MKKLFLLTLSVLSAHQNCPPQSVQVYIADQLESNSSISYLKYNLGIIHQNTFLTECKILRVPLGEFPGSCSGIFSLNVGFTWTQTQVKRAGLQFFSLGTWTQLGFYFGESNSNPAAVTWRQHLLSDTHDNVCF